MVEMEPIERSNQSRLGTSKELLGVLREGILLVAVSYLVLALFFWPDSLRRMMTRAGIRTVDVAGLEFELYESKEAVAKALRTLDSVSGDLQAGQTALRQLSASMYDPNLRPPLREIERRLEDSRKDTRAVTLNLKRRAVIQDSLLRRIQQ